MRETDLENIQCCTSNHAGLSSLSGLTEGSSRQKRPTQPNCAGQIPQPKEHCDLMNSSPAPKTAPETYPAATMRAGNLTAMSNRAQKLRTYGKRSQKSSRTRFIGKKASPAFVPRHARHATIDKRRVCDSNDDGKKSSEQISSDEREPDPKSAGFALQKPQTFHSIIEAPNPPTTKDDALLQTRATVALPLSQETKMDSDPSPTQSNDGRSYDQYFNDSLPDPNTVPLTTQPRSQGAMDDNQSPILIRDDDLVGAMNLGVHHSDARPETQSSAVDSGSAHTAKPTRSRRNNASQRSRWFPETPAAKHNPFGKNQCLASVIDSSQLFKETPGAVVWRRASPTSSRPSPNDSQRRSTSPPMGASSPLKRRGLPSSPGGNYSISKKIPCTSLGQEDGQSTANNTGLSRHHRMPESPQTEEKAALGHVYEPMDKSQKRRDSAQGQLEPHGSVDEDDGDSLSRQIKAKSKKKAALQGLKSIPAGSDQRWIGVEIPPTNKKRKGRADAEHSVAQCNGTEPMDQGHSQGRETVADSQEQHANRNGAKGSTWSQRAREENSEQQQFDSMPSTASYLPDHEKGRVSDQSHGAAALEVCNLDPVSEISPAHEHGYTAGSRCLSNVGHGPSLSRAVRSSPPLRSMRLRSADPGNGHSAPTSSTRRSKQAGVSGSTAPIPPAPKSSEQNDGEEVRFRTLVIEEHGVELQAPEGKTTPDEERADLGSGLPALQTRNRLDTMPSAHDLVAGTSIADSKGVTNKETTPESGSTLGSLSCPPSILSTGTTPATQGSSSDVKPSAAKKDELFSSSPASAKDLRRNTPTTMPTLKTGLAEPVKRSTRRSSRRRPEPPDELARSVSPPPRDTLHRTARPSMSRLGRAAVHANLDAVRQQSLQGRPIFSGMVFAISFQSKRPGEKEERYEARLESVKALETRIKEAGGSVLGSGFDELFEVPEKSASTSMSASPPQSGIKLLTAAKSIGFAALIADGHSRKVKYMQALALGLPCLAARWIETCLDKGDTVDWSPYLLCAGQSAFLGDAMRSRQLAPYDVLKSQLVEVIEQRARLLEGSRILLLMKKSDEGKKKAYVFLARALGASLSRVYNADAARSQLKAAEDQGQPFDWVYLDGTSDSRKVFAGASALNGKFMDTSRKRKRTRDSAPIGPAPTRVRTLSDELMIQSLILGNLIEEGVMQL